MLRYYHDDEDVKNDIELKDYLNELSADGWVSFGGRYGNVSIFFAIVISCLFLEC